MVDRSLMIILEKVFRRIFHKSEVSPKHIFALFSFIFVIWAAYRYFPEILPIWAEELILKPIVWLLPTFWLVGKIEKQPFSSLGFSKKNLPLSFYWGVGLGIVFTLEGLLTNIFKHKGLHLAALEGGFWGVLGSLGLSFVAAISEETVFRGYIFNRLWQIWKQEYLANVVSAFLFVIIYLPVGVFVLSYTPTVMLVYLLLVFVYGLGAAFVFARTKNLLSSILLHVFWSWTILLFR